MEKENPLLQTTVTYFRFLPERDRVDGCNEMLD